MSKAEVEKWEEGTRGKELTPFQKANENVPYYSIYSSVQSCTGWIAVEAVVGRAATNQSLVTRLVC